MNRDKVDQFLPATFYDRHGLYEQARRRCRNLRFLPSDRFIEPLTGNTELLDTCRCPLICSSFIVKVTVIVGPFH